MKLEGTKTGNKLSDEGQLAALDVRVGLSVNRGRKLVQFTEKELIENHMRVLFSIPEHREYFYSGYPSEPILAEAAAQSIHLNNMAQGIPAILTEWCDDNLLSEEDRRELVARLLITKAHDYAIRARSPSHNPSTFTKPVLLTDFLTALIGKDCAKIVFDALPNNIHDPTRLIDSPLGKAKLNFTHWVKADDDCAVMDETAWIGLARNMAWQCSDEQNDVDLLTPLLLWDTSDETKLGRYNVSAIFWKIKNQGRLQNVEVDAEKLKFFTRNPAKSQAAKKSNSRPYLTIILNLDGIRSKFSYKQASVHTSPKKGSTDHHPRYTIMISGCSHDAFPNVIERGEEAVYDAVLNPKTLFEKDSGQDTRKALEKMKPFWKKNKERIGAFSEVSRGKSCLDAPTRQVPKQCGVEVKGFRSDSELDESLEGSEDEGDGTNEDAADRAIGEDEEVGGDEDEDEDEDEEGEDNGDKDDEEDDEYDDEEDEDEEADEDNKVNEESRRPSKRLKVWAITTFCILIYVDLPWA